MVRSKTEQIQYLHDGMNISRADWRLFSQRIGEWQEAYMARLNQEYIDMLSAEGNASEKFWALEKRIKVDKKAPGVQLMLKKADAAWDMVRLLKDGAITAADLEGFSEHLQESVLYYAFKNAQW